MYPPLKNIIASCMHSNLNKLVITQAGRIHLEGHRMWTVWNEIWIYNALSSYIPKSILYAFHTSNLYLHEQMIQQMTIKSPPMSNPNEVKHNVTLLNIIFQWATEWHRWTHQTLCVLRCLVQHLHTYTVADSCMTTLDLLRSQLTKTAHLGSCGSFVDNEHAKPDDGYGQTVSTSLLRDNDSNCQKKIVKYGRKVWAQT